jgi:hypothetical protein
MDFSTFDESEYVKGSLESIREVLHENEVDKLHLLSVTMSAGAWFDSLQAVALAGTMLYQMLEAIPEKFSAEKEDFGYGFEMAKIIYNEIYDALTRLSEEVKK